MNETIIPMDDKLHPLGTLMFCDRITPNNDTNFFPTRDIWRVKAHVECQDFPGGPVRLACSIELARQERL